MADDGKDWISNLPDDLIHQILSFVPMDDIRRMRSVSKFWEDMWTSIPVLYFEEFGDDCIVRMAEHPTLYPFIDMCSLRKVPHRMFVNFVDYILDRRAASSDEKLNVTRFKLYLDHLYGLSVPAAKIDNWLNSALAMRVKELDLCIRPYLPRPLEHIYRFPRSALNNARSLTVLKLEGIRLKTKFPIRLPSLSTLSVINVILEDETFQNLISGCANIKDLHLSGYKKDEEGVYGGSLSGVDLTVCVALRSLSLRHSEFTNQWLEHLTFGLPLLERFTLDSCCGSKNFNIHSQSLKSFYFFGEEFDDYDDYVRCHMNVALNTPNLVYFNYQGDVSFGFSVDSANLLEANLSVSSDYGDKAMYLNLLSLLSNLNCSSLTTMRLYVTCEAEVLLIPKDIREMCFSPLPDLKHLRVKIHEAHDFSTNSELREALRWCAPSVETLEVGSYSCRALKEGCETST